MTQSSTSFFRVPKGRPIVLTDLVFILDTSDCIWTINYMGTFFFLYVASQPLLLDHNMHHEFLRGGFSMCCTPNLSDPGTLFSRPNAISASRYRCVIPGWSSSRPNLVKYQGYSPSSSSPFQITFKIPGLIRIPKIPFLVCFGAEDSSKQLIGVIRGKEVTHSGP